jgi:hypothetical protein
MPRALSEPLTVPPSGAGDTAFMLAAVVTREGTIRNLELLTPISGPAAVPGTDEAILGVLARARFEPARVAGSPVAVNMVWLVAQTTVRASEPAPKLGVASAIRRPAVFVGAAALSKRALA